MKNDFQKIIYKYIMTPDDGNIITLEGVDSMDIELREDISQMELYILYRRGFDKYVKKIIKDND